jgi:hypothetical protein
MAPPYKCPPSIILLSLIADRQRGRTHLFTITIDHRHDMIDASAMVTRNIEYIIISYLRRSNHDLH